MLSTIRHLDAGEFRQQLAPEQAVATVANHVGQEHVAGLRLHAVILAPLLADGETGKGDDPGTEVEAIDAEAELAQHINKDHFLRIKALWV
jgi:hypothetical protein